MITPAELEHLAELSRIKLTDEDKKSLVKEFDSILSYIDQLKKISTETESRVGIVRNIMRNDEAKPVSEEDRKRLLEGIPNRIGDFVAVKKINPRCRTS